jgi:ubiquinone/menaquinone biosynthesis C-methylase UbiE
MAARVGDPSKTYSRVTMEQKRAFFNHIASSWDEIQRGPQIAPGIRNFVQCAYLDGARSILDAGCGTGILVPSLLAAYARTKLIIELDFAEEMLRRNRAKYRNSRLVRLAGDATNLPFPDESIDLILCFNTAPHLGDGEAAFRELFRVLAPGGTMAVGHLMSSLELNRFHANLNGPIAQDRLPPAKEMGKLFGALGGKDVIAQEQPGWYFVRVNKPE